MANALSDLNKALFEQLDRLSNTADLEAEVVRSQALVGVSDRIMNIANASLKAAALFGEYGPPIVDYLPKVGAALPPIGQVGKDT